MDMRVLSSDASGEARTFSLLTRAQGSTAVGRSARSRGLLSRGVVLLTLLTACNGDLNSVTPTPTPPADPHSTGDEGPFYWSAFTTGEQVKPFYALTGDAGRLYLAGDGGSVWEWDGTTLNLLNTLTTTEGESPAIQGLWLHSDFYGKLLVGVGDRGLIFTYDFGADGFIIQQTNTLSSFKDVQVFDRNNMWAVGDGGVYTLRDENWVRDTSVPGSVQLDAVWGTSADDLYVAGDAGTLFHRSSAGWSRISLGRGENLYALWGSGSSSVYAAGQNGLIMHFDGSQWAVQETGSFDHLWALWGLSDAALFAAGTNGTTLYYDGVGWQDLSTGTGANLYGLWGRDIAHVYASGNRGTLLQFDNDPTPPPYEE